MCSKCKSPFLASIIFCIGRQIDCHGGQEGQPQLTERYSASADICMLHVQRGKGDDEQRSQDNYGADVTRRSKGPLIYHLYLKR